MRELATVICVTTSHFLPPEKKKCCAIFGFQHPTAVTTIQSGFGRKPGPAANEKTSTFLRFIHVADLKQTFYLPNFCQVHRSDFHLNSFQCSTAKFNHVFKFGPQSFVMRTLQVNWNLSHRISLEGGSTFIVCCQWTFFISTWRVSKWGVKNPPERTSGENSALKRELPATTEFWTLPLSLISKFTSPRGFVQNGELRLLCCLQSRGDFNDKILKWALLLSASRSKEFTCS